MSKSADLLELQLYRLGKNEQVLEEKIRQLRQVGKDAVVAGRTEDADLTWKFYEETQLILAQLKIEITKVEVQLYTLRRRK